MRQKKSHPNRICYKEEITAGLAVRGYKQGRKNERNTVDHQCKAMSTCRGGVHLEDEDEDPLCFFCSGKKDTSSLRYSTLTLTLFQSVLQVGGTAMYTYTRPHKHNNVFRALVSANIHNHICVVEPLLEGGGVMPRVLSIGPKERGRSSKQFSWF